MLCAYCTLVVQIDVGQQVRIVRRSDEIAKVRCPATLIIGERDQMTTPRQTRDIAQALKARVITVPAGHDLMAEAPEAVLMALREVLV